jgi:hypothetical protein
MRSAITTAASSNNAHPDNRSTEGKDMTVSSSKPQLEEAWIAVQFQLAGLTAEYEGDIPEVVYSVRDEAYAAIEGEYRGLLSMYRGDNAVGGPGL